MPTLFRRRQVWLPTWQGALLLVVVVAARRPRSRFASSAGYLARERPRHNSRRARREHADRRRLARGGRPRRRDRGDRARALRARRRLGRPDRQLARGPSVADLRRACRRLSASPRRRRRSPWSPSRRPNRRRTAPSSARSSCATGCAGRASRSTRSICSRAASTRAARGSSSRWPSGRRSTSASSPPRRDATRSSAGGRRARASRRCSTRRSRLAWTACCFAPPAAGVARGARAGAEIAGLSGSPRSRAPPFNGGHHPSTETAMPTRRASAHPSRRRRGQRLQRAAGRGRRLAWSTCRSSTAAAARRSRPGAIAAPATSPADPAIATRCA